MLRRLETPQIPGEESEIANLKDIFISQLSPQRRNVFIMHREEGLSYKQIADKLHISVATVKKTMSEALATLRKALHIYKDKIILIYILFTGV